MSLTLLCFVLLSFGKESAAFAGEPAGDRSWRAASPAAAPGRTARPERARGPACALGPPSGGRRRARASRCEPSRAPEKGGREAVGTNHRLRGAAPNHALTLSPRRNLVLGLATTNTQQERTTTVSPFVLLPHGFGRGWDTIQDMAPVDRLPCCWVFNEHTAACQSVKSRALTDDAQPGCVQVAAPPDRRQPCAARRSAQWRRRCSQGCR